MELEGLIIYKQTLQLIYYTEMILEKYPKSERYALTSEIKRHTYEVMHLIIKAQKARANIDRLKILDEMDTQLKMIKVLIRLSLRRKYINYKNCNAWSNKLLNIGNLLGGWMKSCRRH